MESLILDPEARQVLQILTDTERVADQVLQNKQEVVALDKRRQSTREAIRDLGKNVDKKVWITVGPILVKMERNKAINLMKKDQQVVDLEVNKLRSEQKVLVAKLRELECLEPMKGFDLKPLDRQEVNALRSNLSGFM